MPIVLDLNGLDGQGQPLFPEDRFFIAVTDVTPEPGALALIAAGGAFMLRRRRA